MFTYLLLPSSLRTPLTAVSAAVRSKVTKNVRKAVVGEQLRSKTVRPAMKAQLHLPPLDLSLSSVRGCNRNNGALRPHKAYRLLGTGKGEGGVGYL